MRRLTVIAVSASAALVMTSCMGTITARTGGNPYPAGEVSLVAFDSCDQALRELKDAALEQVGPYGLGGDDMWIMEDAEAMPADAEGSAERAPEHSTTNVHEADADEPDLVKTDGRRIVTITNGTLRVVDVASQAVVGSVEIPNGYGSELLLHGDRVLVFADAPYDVLEDEASSPRPHGGSGAMDIVLVDLAGGVRIAGTLTVDGSIVDARRTGSIARVVVRSGPRLDFSYPERPGEEAEAQAENEDVIEESTIEDWLPHFELRENGTQRGDRLVDCSAISHPATGAGTSLLTVLTFDLTRELGDGDAVAVTADGGTVYATGQTLYVADDGVLAGMEPGGERRTTIHQFDTAGPGQPTYLASGSVEGTLLNQYALSEHDSHLRIATTVGGQAENVLTVLARNGGELLPVGRVDGLGPDERIYAVRYLGDVAYVVTFRQTDPLYRLDLSDPAEPKVTGELKITGYSGYLHPIDDDRLLGVGQEATEQGTTTGAQVSLFDVSDPAAPERVAQHHVPDGHSEVEHDPHAFLYWPGRDLVVLPVERWYAHDDSGEMYALVLRIDGDSLAEVGAISHPSAEWGAWIRRSVVIGDSLYTLSDAGLMVNAIDSLAQQAWLPFA